MPNTALVPLKDCPKCDGDGYYYECLISFGPFSDGPSQTCEMCGGAGKVPYSAYLSWTYSPRGGPSWGRDWKREFGGYLEQNGTP